MALKAFYVSLAVLLGISGWWGWRTWQTSTQSTEAPAAATVKPPLGSVPVRISPQAKANMGLVSAPTKPGAYWRTAEFPAVIVEKPSITSRGVVAPIAGVVSKIHAFPGDTVAANAPLATLRLLSDSVYSSQLELFKATKDSDIIRARSSDCQQPRRVRCRSRDQLNLKTNWSGRQRQFKPTAKI